MENNRYSNSKVYKIIDNTENQYYYIGSTTTSFERKGQESITKTVMET